MIVECQLCHREEQNDSSGRLWRHGPGRQTHKNSGCRSGSMWLMSWLKHKIKTELFIYTGHVAKVPYMTESLDEKRFEISVIGYNIISLGCPRVWDDVMATHKARQNTVTWITVDYFLHLDPNEIINEIILIHLD